MKARTLAAGEALKLNAQLEDTRAELAGKYALGANARIEKARGSLKALLRLYYGSINTLLRLS